LVLYTLRTARRVFTDTPIERLPITGWIRSRLFRAAYGSGELETTIRGLTLTLPGGDVSMVPSLVAGYHEELELEIFERIAQDSSVISDVGANVGLYTCVGARAMPAGTVVAFEPAPANLEFLRRNLARNGVEDRVEVVPEAVSDTPGQARFFLSDGIGNHSLASGNAGSERHLDVTVTTVDQHFAGRLVDILKIDVEGFDTHVLKGARETLAAHHPAIFVELLTSHLEQGGISPRDLVNILADLYAHIFLVDNVRRTVRQSTREELLKLAGEQVHTNLIAVDRPAHLAAVKAFGRQ
jgi:FkbM family methyltransferase